MDKIYRLLIVDDEPHIIEGLRRILDWDRYGICQIETATNYHEAVEKAIEYKPHIGIFDVCIDTARGYDIIAKLNSMSLPTKYIMVSGYDEFEYVRQAMLVGAKDYLVKPVNREQLQRIVEEIIVNDFHGELGIDTYEEKSVDPVLGLPYASLSNLTNKILLIVQGEYGQNINLKIIADKFKMNSTYLGQIFLKESHMKFSEYLMAYRMTMAKQKIQNSTEKISYIAYSVGYANLNYFYTHFHDFFGLSPSDLRVTDTED